MTSVTFETSTIADSIKKANRVAPSKGAAFDKASGLLFEVNPATNEVILRATNLDVYYMEWVDSVKMEGDAAVWRVPSALVNGIVSGLPIGTGKQVTFTSDPDGNRIVHLTSGRTKARINTISDEYYPIWHPFDPDKVVGVTALGARLTQVEWACENGTEVPWSGVHLTGTTAIASDKYKLASVPLEAPMLDRPITIPGGILGPILNQMSDTGVGIEGDQLLLMPDEHTQIRTVLFAQAHGDMSRVMNPVRPNKVLFRKDDLVACITRMLNLVKADRFPMLQIFIGNEELACYMQESEVGAMEDALELPGQALHDPVEIRFVPKHLTEALNASPNDSVALGYDPSNTNKPVYLDGGSGYESWIAPRKGTE